MKLTCRNSIWKIDWLQCGRGGKLSTEDTFENEQERELSDTLQNEVDEDVKNDLRLLFGFRLVGIWNTRRIIKMMR